MITIDVLYTAANNHVTIHQLNMVQDTMNANTLKQYLADDPPTVVPLAIKPHFEALNNKEQKYAHYISRAALSGTRVNLRQVSLESEAIYDFIIALHKSCNGTYSTLINLLPFKAFSFLSFKLHQVHCCSHYVRDEPAIASPDTAGY